ncbi:hypothetical protein BDA99DRAFT_540693 [Phascolomyces articulosus]|uniref:CxC1-like cysteine cluster associated with KDZ transposases domain-containing protein n=1 Tax=Phascolomyces articulosus TaxID=60185 RepID=A0AAD5K3A5_9FUNG|nr:hypothetical protein BDA99DRAFT_540693 [Phascolomyces articulosus]
MGKQGRTIVRRRKQPERPPSSIESNQRNQQPQQQQQQQQQQGNGIVSEREDSEQPDQHDTRNLKRPRLDRNTIEESTIGNIGQNRNIISDTYQSPNAIPHNRIVAPNDSSEDAEVVRPHGSVIPDIRVQHPQQNSKSYAERSKETEKKWNELLEDLQKQFKNCYNDGGPKCTDLVEPVTAALKFCECREKEAYKRDIICFFYTGVKKISFTCCKCEEIPVTLLRHSLITSSPFEPKIAFHLPLIEWYSLLRAEGQLSCQAFSFAFTTLHKSKIIKSDTLRKALGNVFFVYEKIVETVDQQLLQYELNEIPQEERSACPACPTKRDAAEKTRVLYRMNIKTLLVKTSWKHKCHQIMMTISYAQVISMLQIKSLQAINKPRFHETGVVGCVCKHDIALEFTTMYQSGEGLKQVYFPELKRSGSKTAIGVFHSIGHSMSCQVYNNPRFIEYMGLVDGEQCERVWSYLGKFVSITRQMSAERRMLTLSHAITHYNKKHLFNIPNTIRRRWLKAKKMIEDANKIIGAYDPSLLTDNAISEEAKKIQYANELHNFYKNQTSQQKTNIVESLERALKADGIIEIRWGDGSENYKNYYRMGQERLLEKEKAHLKAVIVGRTLLQDQLYHTTKLGHKASKKLKSSITNVRTTAMPILKRYNDIYVRSYKDICNLKSDFWDFEVDTVTFRVLREHMNKKRAQEEIDIIKIEEIRARRNEGLLYYRLLDAEDFYLRVYGYHYNRGESFYPGETHLYEAFDGVDDNLEGVNNYNEGTEDEDNINDEDSGADETESQDDVQVDRVAVDRLYEEIENEEEKDDEEENEENVDTVQPIRGTKVFCTGSKVCQEFAVSAYISMSFNKLVTMERISFQTWEIYCSACFQLVGLDAKCSFRCFTVQPIRGTKSFLYRIQSVSGVCCVCVYFHVIQQVGYYGKDFISDMGNILQRLFSIGWIGCKVFFQMLCMRDAFVWCLG